MRSLLDFIVKHSYVFLFILLETLSLVLLFGFNDRQKEAFLTSAGGLSGSIYELRSEVGQYFGLKKENEQLVEENAILRQRLFSLADSAAIRFEDSLPTGQVVVARVIDNSVRRDDNYITIDKGQSDGLEKGMGVYNSSGVVGVVLLSGRHYSIVLPLLNAKTSVSCKVMGSDNFGFVEWNGGDPYKVQLNDMPYHSDVRVGDTIVTTGYSSVFPEGIMVGIVSDVEQMKSGYSLRIAVDLAVDMGNLGWVYVHSKTPDPEIGELKSQIR